VVATRTERVRADPSVAARNRQKRRAPSGLASFQVGLVPVHQASFPQVELRLDKGWFGL